MNESTYEQRIATHMGKSLAEVNDFVNAMKIVSCEIFDEGVDEIKLRNFGTFYRHDAPAQKDINPNTGDEIQTEPRSYVRFRQSKHLFRAVNGLLPEPTAATEGDDNQTETCTEGKENAPNEE